MRPVFTIGSNDYTAFVAELKPTRNDLDADGSGRNLLNGLMYRSRIAQKVKLQVTFNRLDENTMARLLTDLNAEYVTVTTLDSRTNTTQSRTFYCSTINEGVQRLVGRKTVYDGATFNLTER